MSAVDGTLRAFVSFMDSCPPPWVLLPFALVTMTSFTLLHELGHAAAALALRPGRRVWVVAGRHPDLGGRPQPVDWVVCGRLAIAFSLLPSFRRTGGLCVYEPPASPTERAVIALAGPAASLVVCLAAWNGLVRAEPGQLHDLLWMITYFELVAVVVNLVPVTFRDGTRSDGRVILAAVR